MSPILVSAPAEIEGVLLHQVKLEMEEILGRVTSDGDELVVNDTKWFQIQKNQPTPTVMNSAKFITSAIQKNLEALDWKTETELLGQTIDGFKEFGCSGGLKLTRESVLSAVGKKWTTDRTDNVPDLFAGLYRKYYLRGCFGLSSDLKELSYLFTEREEHLNVRIGFEFETGNIASSFRALSKLDSLYKQGAIDIGVFVTSIDKGSTATRIWPSSNRNGSFEELKNRDYKRNVEVPLIEYGFRPDRIDSTAPYLFKDGSTYYPIFTGKDVEVSGKLFSIYTSDGVEVLLPK